jgi:hypothetical protein
MVTCIASLRLIMLDCVVPFAPLLNHNDLYSKQHTYMHLQGGHSVLGSGFASHCVHQPVAFAGHLQWTELALLMFLLLALPAVPQPLRTVR